MPVTVRFENGTVREFPTATDVEQHGQGAVLRSQDGKEVAALDGPIASMTINGETFDWPPN
jgi:hypothetical protein